MIKICVLGAGRLSTQVHGPSLRDYQKLHPEIELSAICDLDDKAAKQYAETFGFKRTYSKFEQMLESEKPQGVYVIVPVMLTPSLSKIAMEHRVPVLLEKPPGLTLQDIDSMIETARRTGTPNFVAFNRRHCPLVRHLRDHLRSEILEKGEKIQSVTYQFVRVNRNDPDFSTTAIHGIDTTSFLGDSPYQQVHLSYQAFPQHGPTVTDIYIQGILQSGTSVTLTFTPMAGILTERAVIHTFDNTFEIKVPTGSGVDNPGEIIWYKNGKLHRHIKGEEFCKDGAFHVESGFYAETKMFLDGVRAGVKDFPGNNIESGRISVQIAEAVRNRRTHEKFNS